MSPPPTDSRRAAARAGVVTVLPMMVGIVPFGLVAGAVPIAEGMSAGEAIGFSSLLFAGASQLATIDVLANGGGALVAAFTAWTINLRLVLYSASLAPYLAHEPLHRRLLAAHVLVDQNYALSIARWSNDPPEHRLPFFAAQGAFLFVCWQITTLIGVVAGSSVPDDIPLTFAVPLVFLVLLVPTLTNRPAIAAAAVGGTAALVAHEVGLGNVAIAIGCVAGIVAGTTVATVVERADAGSGAP